MTDLDLETGAKRGYKTGKRGKSVHDWYQRLSNWKKWLLALIAVAAVLGIALGVGLGVGLKNNNNNSSDRDSDN